jgi:FkbM family methyltransferase
MLYWVISSPLVGYPLLLCWYKGWLPKPRNDATARLKDGRLLRCQLADMTQCTMYVGLFEPRETRLLSELLHPGDTFIDVGAHIGWFTTMAARCVGGAGNVIACEPYPSNASMLKVNVAENRYTNVCVIEDALGDQPGTLSLAKGGGSGGVTALDWAREGRVEVPVTTLDDLATDLDTIALLKIDVEGWEAHVLQGAARTLSRTAHVLIEINKPALRKAGSSPEEILGLLRTAGFGTFTPMTERGLRRLRRSDITNVLATRLLGATGPYRCANGSLLTQDVAALPGPARRRPLGARRAPPPLESPR